MPIRTVQFTGVGWSPDGEYFGILYVALEYASYDTPNALSPDTEACSGLLLVSVGSGFGLSFSISGDSGFFAAASGTYDGYSIWNTTGPTCYPPQMVAPALVYGWSANGQPQSVSPLNGQTVTCLPTRAGPSYPVGNPSTNSTYSVWQPGLVAGPEVFGGGSASVGDDDVFVTQFATWTHATGQIRHYDRGRSRAGSAGEPARDGYRADSQQPNRGTAHTPAVPVHPGSRSRLGALRRSTADWRRWLGNDRLERRRDGAGQHQLRSGGGSPRLELRDTETGALVGSSSLGLPAGDPGCSTYNFSQSLDDYPNPNLSLQWSPYRLACSLDRPDRQSGDSLAGHLSMILRRFPLIPDDSLGDLGLSY